MPPLSPWGHEQFCFLKVLVNNFLYWSPVSLFYRLVLIIIRAVYWFTVKYQCTADYLTNLVGVRMVKILLMLNECRLVKIIVVSQWLRLSKGCVFTSQNHHYTMVRSFISEALHRLLTCILPQLCLWKKASVKWVNVLCYSNNIMTYFIIATL